MLKVKRAQGQNVMYLLPGARGKTTSPFGWPHGTNYVTRFNKPKVCILQYHPYLLPKEYQKCYYYHNFTSSGAPHFQPPFPLPELWTTKFRSVYLTFIFIVLLSFCGNVLLIFHLYPLCSFREPFQFLLHCSLYPQAGSRSGRVVGALLECFLLYSAYE